MQNHVEIMKSTCVHLFSQARCVQCHGVLYYAPGNALYCRDERALALCSTHPGNAWPQPPGWEVGGGRWLSFASPRPHFHGRTNPMACPPPSRKQCWHHVYYLGRGPGRPRALTGRDGAHANLPAPVFPTPISHAKVKMCLGPEYMVATSTFLG